MKKVYFAMTIKEGKDFANEDGNFYCVYGISTCRNIKSVLDDEKIIFAHYCESKKQALKVMNAWIESNGSEWQKKYGGYIHNFS